MWGGFVVTLPWQMYLQYGDKRVLETNYPMIQKWLAYLARKPSDNVLIGRTRATAMADMELSSETG